MLKTLFAALACLVTLALLPAGAHASAMVVQPMIQGPGAITECGPIAQSGAQKHACAELDTGDANQNSSAYVSYAAAANAAQPNKSAFAGWTCTSIPAANVCNSCNGTSTCQLFSPTVHGTYTVIITAVFKDTTKPVLSGVNATLSPTLQGQVFFSWNADDDIATAYCSIDASPWIVCPVGNAVFFGEGVHTFSVKAADPSGNVSDPTPLIAFKIVDTQLTGGPDGHTTDPKPTFTYSSGAGTAFECAVDGAPLSPCGNGTQTVGPLDAGKHTFSVRAAGDMSPAVRTFFVDQSQPGIAVLAPASTPAPPTTPTHLKIAVKATGKGTKLKSLTLRGVPLDATVSATCTCSHTRVSKRGATRITAFRKLPLKAKLTVTVSAPGALPTVATITARRGHSPRVSVR